MVILSGVEIGDGAVVGAGSIVSKNILPYSINAGVPSKQIKLRFKNVINFLSKLKWWD